jgi:eukaryotic translation initiation factor 2C
MYGSNIAFKINTKLGGVNNYLAPDVIKTLHSKISGRPMNSHPSRIMILGADVTHPGPGQQELSIAAVTGSMDLNFWDYRSVIKPQTGRVEVIESIKDMCKELLLLYKNYNSNQLPDHLLFYRDGVSEGQFNEIMIREIPEVRRAMIELGADQDKIKITFLIINKRHHTRFMCKNNGDANRSGNIPAGTVIDTDVTLPNEFDFFLNSHGGILGTSKSSHYHVLWDENKFSSDTIQDITNKLCYLYARCSKAVSMVPSAYYAHLVAARARQHCGMEDSFSENGSSDFAFKNVQPILGKSRMYFV